MKLDSPALFLATASILTTAAAPGDDGAELPNQLSASDAGTPVVSDGFDYPVGAPDARGYKNKQRFGAFNTRFEKYHLGEDWNRGACNDDLGDPVYAVSNGTVAYADLYNPSWGNIVRIHHILPSEEHGGVVESLYAHVHNIVVKQGQAVRRGQLVASIGHSGTSAGDCAHLHFEMRSDETIGVARGYTPSEEPPAGWLNPTEFIDAHRTF